MKFNKETGRVERTAEEKAAHKAIHDRFKNDKPSLEQMLSKGEIKWVMPGRLYLELKVMLHQMKQDREASGLSLADVAEKSGMDKAVLSRLENGHQPNPTIETLSRYAAAIGKKIVWSYQDASAS